jgi:hypothetical protein
MPLAVVVVIVIAAIIIFGGAYGVGTVAGRGTETPAGGTNIFDPEACQDACNQWDARRQERCNAEAAAAAARKERDSITVQLAGVLATAAALFAAAIAAALVPFVGEAVAGVLLAAAAAMLVLAVFYAGMLSSANDDVSSKESAAQKARDKEAEARSILFATCTPDESDKCLMRPAPC